VKKIMADKSKKAKKDIKDIFNCDNLDNFINSIIKVLPFKGYSDSRFFKCQVNGISFLVKLSLYKKTDPEVYGISRKENPTDTEIKILELLKDELIYKNLTPCIIETLYTKKCNTHKYILSSQRECDRLLMYGHDSIKDMVKDVFCYHKELVDAGLNYDSFAFIVIEECDITLREYLTKHFLFGRIDYEIFRSIMFQIFHAYHQIKTLYPDFYHGDFHGDNIMLKVDKTFKYDPDRPYYLLFNTNDLGQFAVPYFGIIAKIIDFGFSSIPAKGIHSAIEDDKYITFKSLSNDILFLMADIYKFLDLDRIYNEFVISFYQTLMPSGAYRIVNNDYINRNKDMSIESKDILTNKVYEDYKEKSGHIISSSVWHEYEAPA
jgi:serine/threonine protein kinase